MTGSMETRFGLIENNLTMITHPDLVDRVNRDQRATERGDAVRESFNSGVVYSLKNEKVAGANQMTAPNPTLHPFFTLWWQHACFHLGFMVGN
jgi:hypothetical protein